MCGRLYFGDDVLTVTNDLVFKFNGVQLDEKHGIYSNDRLMIMVDAGHFHVYINDYYCINRSNFSYSINEEKIIGSERYLITTSTKSARSTYH